MTEPRTCGRCGAQETHEHRLRLSLVNLEREAREDGYLSYPGSNYSHEERCVDRDACRARARQNREAAR